MILSRPLRSFGIIAGAAFLLAGSRIAADLVPAADRLLIEAHADQVQGPSHALAVANLSYEQAFGPTVATLADPALRWLRAAPCVRYARCSQWLADGLSSPDARAFSGCRVYRESTAGEPEYHWEALDRALDVLVASGLRPVIVCGGMPDALAAPGSARGAGGGMTGRPKDYARYQGLIEALARHVEKAYGREEVRGWAFEVWDQPDRSEYWEGGGLPAGAAAYPAERIEPFLRLYDHFAAGLTAIDPQLRFGGPGVAGDERFLRAFLEHCAKGKNLVTGRQGARLDFVALHAADPGEARSRWRAEIDKSFPELTRAAFFVTVPAAGDGSPGTRDAIAGAAAAVRLCTQAGAANTGARGTDLCFQEAQLIDDHFGAQPAAITRLGRYTVPLPLLRAAMMLSKTGPDAVALNLKPGIGGFATRGGEDTAQVILYRPEAASGAAPLPLRVRVSGLPRTLVQSAARVYQIDASHYNAYGDWLAAGKPFPAPDPLASKWVGREIYAPAVTIENCPVADGAASIDLDLAPGGVALVTVGPEPLVKAIEVKFFDKNTRPRRILEGEEAYYTAAQNQQAREFDEAERQYLEMARKYADSYWAQLALATLLEMYEFDAHKPDKAEAARARLLQMPIDDFERERLIRQRLVAAVRAGDTAAAESIRKQVAAIDARLAAVAYHPGAAAGKE